MEMGPHKDRENGIENGRENGIEWDIPFYPIDEISYSSVERRKSNPKVVGSIPTLVRVFLCPCVGPFPSVGLTLTWFIWDRNLALHLTLDSVNSVITRSRQKARENVHALATIGFGFTFDWLKTWRENFEPINE